MDAGAGEKRTAPPPRRAKFPFAPLLVLIATIYLFWILPRQLGERPVQVEFEPAPDAPRASSTTAP